MQVQKISTITKIIDSKAKKIKTNQLILQKTNNLAL